MLGKACPSCSYIHDALTDARGGVEKPSPGDYTVCLNCAALLTFQDDLSIKLMSEEEKQLVNPEDMVFIHKVQSTIRSLPEYGKLIRVKN